MPGVEVAASSAVTGRGGPAVPELEVNHIVIDCAEHEPVIAFWSRALGGWEPERWNEQFVLLTPPAGANGTPLLLQKVPEPKIVKNRVHLDLRTGDLDRTVEALQALGAVIVIERQDLGIRWFVMADPEGNEFCVTGSGSPDGA